MQAEERPSRNWRRVWYDARVLSRSLGSIPSWTGLLTAVDNQHLSETWAPRDKYSNSRGKPVLDDQARFQQRRIVEKEQKLLEMYEANQARVLGRLGTKPAPAPAGKVRQMFEERRTKAGIDKSYPLQPLSGAPVTRAPPPRSNGHFISGQKSSSLEVNHEVKQSSSYISESTTTFKSQRIETKISKDINLNEDLVDNANFSDLTEMEPIANKLPNVGGSLPSQKVIKREPNNNLKNGTTVKKSPDVEPKINGNITPNDRKTSQRITKTPPIQSIKSTAARSTKTPSVTPTPKARPVASPQMSTTPTPTTPIKTRSPVTPTVTTKPKTPVTKAPSSRSSSSMATKVTTTSSPTSSPGSGETCGICQRRFAADRIQKHQEICAKTSTKKRKQYDALKHRVAGTEAESYVKKTRKPSRTQAVTTQSTATAKPSNWRKKHEEFIAAIRAAKEVQAHISKGGKLSDLPPPPPSDTSDYIPCPHCNRRFGQGAAERHIPKCANYQFNKKPKPAAKRR